MTLSTRAWSALGIGLGYLADRWIGDPRRWHPVAGFGQVASRLETVTYADRRSAGVIHVATLVSAAATLGWGVERLAARHRALTIISTAAATWTVLGGRSLAREAMIISAQLAADDLEAARHRVRNLVGRETADLSADEVARATVESLAENTSDAVVAPLFWGVVAGIPGLLGYRAVNTLDAMVGHRSPRYRRFGWAAARLDDVVNWLPARLAAVSTAAAAPLAGGSTRETLRIVVRDAGRHPSPNAGVVEAAFAGALGVRLGGRNVYHGEAEHRGVLGDGRPVRTTDIAGATRLAAVVSGAAMVGGVVLRGVAAMTILILGGTREARELAAALVDIGGDVISSLAGRVSRPALPVGRIRVGGFGGADGLVDYLRAGQVTAVVDATHPFAARISANAASAAARAGVPLLRLERPGWRGHPQSGSWTWVADATAARIAAEDGRRPFVTTGRQSLEAFLPWADRRVTVRVVDPPGFALPVAWTVIASRGPYSYDNERRLMIDHGVDVLITKDSGGDLTRAKLDAAADLGVPVVIISRPEPADAVPTVDQVTTALDWIRLHDADRASPWRIR